MRPTSPEKRISPVKTIIAFLFEGASVSAYDMLSSVWPGVWRAVSFTFPKKKVFPSWMVSPYSNAKPGP